MFAACVCVCVLVCVGFLLFPHACVLIVMCCVTLSGFVVVLVLWLCVVC